MRPRRAPSRRRGLCRAGRDEPASARRRRRQRRARTAASKNAWTVSPSWQPVLGGTGRRLGDRRGEGGALGAGVTRVDAGRSTAASAAAHGQLRVTGHGAVPDPVMSSPSAGVAELLLQEPAVRDQRVGVRPGRRRRRSCPWSRRAGRAGRSSTISEVLPSSTGRRSAQARGSRGSRRSPRAGSRSRSPSPSARRGCPRRAFAAAGMMSRAVAVIRWTRDETRGPAPGPGRPSRRCRRRCGERSSAAGRRSSGPAAARRRRPSGDPGDPVLEAQSRTDP